MAITVQINTHDDEMDSTTYQGGLSAISIMRAIRKDLKDCNVGRDEWTSITVTITREG